MILTILRAILTPSWHLGNRLKKLKSWIMIRYLKILRKLRRKQAPTQASKSLQQLSLNRTLKVEMTIIQLKTVKRAKLMTRPLQDFTKFKSSQFFQRVTFRVRIF